MRYGVDFVIYQIWRAISVSRGKISAGSNILKSELFFN